jgi:hypothetical protein
LSGDEIPEAVGAVDVEVNMLPVTHHLEAQYLIGELFVEVLHELSEQRLRLFFLLFPVGEVY